MSDRAVSMFAAAMTVSLAAAGTSVISTTARGLTLEDERAMFRNMRPTKLSKKVSSKLVKPMKPRAPRSEFQDAVNLMSGQQRKAWARAGHPGLKQQIHQAIAPFLTEPQIELLRGRHGKAWRA